MRKYQKKIEKMNKKIEKIKKNLMNNMRIMEFFEEKIFYLTNIYN